VINASPETIIESNDNLLKFSQLSTLHGLSNSNVFSITQDHQGFIWFATEDGLNRFDGSNFVTYRHHINDSHSIADNFIRKIFIDSENTLWIGTRNGLSRYNLEFDNFDNFLNKPNDQSSLKDNVIWDIYQNKAAAIAGKIPLLWISTTEGLHTLSLNSSANDLKFERINVRNYNDRIREIKTIFQDKKENYWLGTFDKGIHLLSKNKNYIGSLKNQNKFKVSIDANALFDMKAIDNQYWLATDNGLFILNENYQIISHLTSLPKNNDDSQVLLSNNVRAIEQFDETHIWLATQNGLNTINLVNSQVDSYQRENNSSSISENWLMDIHKDNNDNMWLASYGGSIIKYSPLASIIDHRLANKNYRVESFAETNDGTIWLSTEQHGLLKLDNSDDIVDVNLQLGERIRQVLPSTNDSLWLYTESGKLFNYDFKTKALVAHQKLNIEEASNPQKQLIKIRNSVYYIDSTGLLTKYNTESQKFSQFPFQEKVKLANMQKDKNDNLWLNSDENEIVLFDTKNQLFSDKKLTIPNAYKSQKIVHFQISKNWIWLSLDSQGLILINIENNRTESLNYVSKLQGTHISSILVDEKENAWLATHSGIMMINPLSKKTISFGTDFGLNTPQFILFSSFISQQDKIFLGGPNGVYHFSPERLLQIKPSISKPTFTNLYVVNKKVKILSSNNKNLDSNTTTIRKQLNSLEKIELAYKQSPIRFEFTSPNVKLSSQLRYRYRLIGLEKDWIDAAIDTGNSNNRATYTNLSPGDYVFEVQAYDLHQPNKPQTSRLNVSILPPWWSSTAMLIVYALLTLLFLTYVFQQYRNKQLYNSQIKESEERLKLSLWGSGDEMWDWNIVTDKIYRSNIWGILEFPQDGTRNRSNEKNSLGQIQSNIHQHDLARVKRTLEEHFAERTEHFEATYRVKNKHNRWVWILDRGKVVERDEGNTPTRMTGTLKDISQIKKAEERLKLFARCIQNISDAVVIYDRQFVAVDVNKAFQRITGKERSQMVGRSMIFSQYPTSFTQNIKKHLITKGSWHGEIESLRANGSKYLTDLNIDIIHDENNNISHFVGVFSDITKRKETEAELRKLASSDTLTGLPNRSYFQANQARLVKNNISHALLVFDLDNFKKINDSLGHQIGDAILCQVAQRMLLLGRKQDTVYRLGGDEFSIIIEGTNDIHTITSLAKDILRTVAQPFKIKNQEIVLYSSIGIVLFPEDGITGHELLKNADTAMYHAKDSGGNKYQFFSESMNKQAVKRLQIESLIRHGLKDDSFSVYYQPKIEIATGKIAGMEALVRFETPSKGIISPLVFIPVSEETGQIIDIGEVVLRKACFATKKWVDAGLFDGRVAVNLSAVQFTQSNLVTQISDILKESQLPAKHLELEITEGTVMDSPQTAIDTMLQIRAMGIHLSLDDFGTGYSSLAYLKKFPLNTLKIDKAFVDDIEESEQGRNMVATIVTIAHNLGMDVVAEGVETNNQLSFLSGLRCELLQGYLYSKPLATEHFQKYLLAHKITNKSTAFSS